MRDKGRQGFTLIELLVVIIIILIILGSLVAVFGLMFRSSGLRQGGLVVTTALNAAKMEASRSRQAHYVDLIEDTSNAATIQIYKDMNPADGLPLNFGADIKVGKRIDLPKGVAFGKNDADGPGAAGFPDWIQIAATGYVRYPGGITGVQVSTFETDINTAAPKGDIILHMIAKQMHLYMDVNEIQASVRKAHYSTN